MLSKPYIYVFDGDTAGPSGGALTNGQSYDNLGVPINTTADRFILSRVAGVSTVAAQSRLWTPQRNQLSNNLLYPVPDQVIIPSLSYPNGSVLRVDLGAVSLGNNDYGVLGSVPNYWSQIAFQGQLEYGQLRQPRQASKTQQYTLVGEFTISNTGRVAGAYQLPNAPTRFSIPVDIADFELYHIKAFIQTSGGSWQPADRHIKATFYDSAKEAMSSAPVVDSYWNGSSVYFNSAFPVPGVVFPVTSTIDIDVYSLLIASQVPASLKLCFVGAWRT